MEARPRARRRPLVGDRRSPRRRRVGGDGRTRHRLAPSHRLASSVARLLGSNTPRERWDNRVNYLLRFRKVGQVVRPRGTTLCWMLPLPRSHPDSIWDAIPEPVVQTVLEGSKKRGPVLDPFAGAGTVGRVAASLGREWVGVERDPRMARVTARRLRLRLVRASLSDRGRAAR